MPLRVLLESQADYPIGPLYVSAYMTALQKLKKSAGHGLYGFDTMGLPILPRFQMQYWYAVLRILRDKIGTDVFVTSVPSYVECLLGDVLSECVVSTYRTGSIQDRAAALHKALETDMKHRKSS